MPEARLVEFISVASSKDPAGPASAALFSQTASTLPCLLALDADQEGVQPEITKLLRAWVFTPA